MIKTPKGQKRGTKQHVFVLSLFVIFFLVLLLMSGIQTGLFVLMNVKQWSTLIQIVVPLIYWAVIAAGLTAYTGWRVKRTFEKPLEIMEKATAKVAGGDFSVYVPPLHTSDKTDYLDTMIINFNKMVEELGSIETLKTDFFPMYRTKSRPLWRLYRPTRKCSAKKNLPMSSVMNMPKTFFNPQCAYRTLLQTCSS